MKIQTMVNMFMVFLMLVLVFVLTMLFRENLQLRSKLAQSQHLVEKYRKLNDRLFDEWRK